MINQHPLPWRARLPNCVEHANPIILSLPKDETRATEDSRATRGNWHEVWDNFDRRKSAKEANDVPAGEADPDMFAQARVAAE